jgi:hypothetical protein
MEVLNNSYMLWISQKIKAFRKLRYIAVDLQFNFSESTFGYHKFFEPLKFQLCWSNLVFYRHGSATRVSKQPKKKVGSLFYANRNKHTV